MKSLKIFNKKMLPVKCILEKKKQHKLHLITGEGGGVKNLAKINYVICDDSLKN